MRSKSLPLLPVILLGALFIAFRLWHLEADLPVWKITYYQALDEPYYMLYAYNYMLFGTVAPTIADFVVHNYNGLGNLMVNLLPYLGVEALGNNYYGVRISSVLLSFAIFLIFAFIARRALQESATTDGKARYALLFLLLYATLDFAFAMAGRVLEPTIFRAAAMMFLLLYAARLLEREMIGAKEAFFLGFFSFSAFVFVYMTNFFLVPAMLTALLIRLAPRGWRTLIKAALWYAAGALAAFALFNLLFYLAFHVDFFTALLDAVRTYSERLAVSGSGESHFLKNVAANLFNFFTTNFFRFDIAALLLFLTTLPIFWLRWREKRDTLSLVVGSALALFFLQTAVLNDFPYRKLIILFPLVTTMLLLLAADLPRTLERFEELRGRKLFRLYAAGSLLLALLVLYRAVFKALAFDPTLRAVVLVCGIATLALFARLLFGPSRSAKKTVAALLALSLIPNLFLDYRHIAANTSYRLVLAEKDIAETVGKAPVLGGMAWSLKPYNDYIPLINVYAYLYHADEATYIDHSRRLQKLFDVHYAVDFYNEKNIRALESIGFRPLRVYDINEATGRPVALYRFEAKTKETTEILPAP